MKVKMKYLAVAVLSLLFTHTVEAQILKGLGKKLEKKTEELAEKAIDRLGNSDQAASNEQGGESKDTDGQSRPASTGPFEDIPLLKNDFVRGTQTIFFDDFSAEVVGEMGTRWTSNGIGTISEVPGIGGKWLKLYHENTYKIKELVRIPENFTLEFDLLTLADAKKGLVVDFGFDHEKGISKHFYLADRNPINIEASYRFDAFEFTSNELKPTKRSKIKANMSYFVNDIMKVKISVVGDRMKAYIDEYKVLDTEMINPMTKKYFYVAVENEDNAAEVYLSNVRISQL